MLINELKKGVAYMQIKNKFIDSVKKVVENEMKISANSTTCGIFYQPTYPDSLKKFSKIENDR